MIRAIIIVLADDMGSNDVSTYGGGAVTTPNIDTLAREGVAFTGGYSGNGTCAPSRAASSRETLSSQLRSLSCRVCSFAFHNGRQS